METYISKDSLTSLTMIGMAKISSKGQLVIPETIRKELGLDTGVTCILRTVDGKLILEKEDSMEQKLALLEKYQEREAWMKLTEHSLKKIWDNDEDEQEWKQYL